MHIAKKIAEAEICECHKSSSKRIFWIGQMVLTKLFLFSRFSTFTFEKLEFKLWNKKLPNGNTWYVPLRSFKSNFIRPQSHKIKKKAMFFFVYFIQFICLFFLPYHKYQNLSWVFYFRSFRFINFLIVWNFTLQIMM